MHATKLWSVVSNGSPILQLVQERRHPMSAAQHGQYSSVIRQISLFEQETGRTFPSAHCSICEPH